MLSVTGGSNKVEARETVSSWFVSHEIPGSTEQGVLTKKESGEENQH